MKKTTHGIIGLILIIGGLIALLFGGRWLLDGIISISNAITTPQAILIGACIIAYNIRPKMHKLTAVPPTIKSREVK